MIGHLTFSEVNLWVQTQTPQLVQFAYRSIDSNEKWSYSKPYMTSKEDAFVHEVTISDLTPGVVFEYRVVLDHKIQTPIGKQVFQTPEHWAYRTAAPEFSFTLGSCAYINEENYDRVGTNYGGDYQIFEHISAQQPHFMLWLGDNVYFREPDWTSRSGMIHRYTHSRHLSELQFLMANTPQYAIWDDHDFGPNNSDRGFIQKEFSKDVFELFWANPSHGNPDLNGITNQFEWSDCQFFLLDNRYNRAPNDRKDGQRTILGTDQLEWFKDALLSSTATFKFVAIGGQFLNTAPVFENFSANGYAKERQEIIDFIYTHQIKNVVFLTGDRHHSELSMLTKDGEPTIYDLTVSPLTSGVHDAAAEANYLRISGSHVAERNYGKITVKGVKDARQLELQLFNAKGSPLFQYLINAE
jgi:alkaline phosphatase D